MTYVTDIADLEAAYGTPGETSLVKVADRLTPEYRAWNEASSFCALASSGPEGLDCSPRGDDGPVVSVLDDTTLAMPDRRGNNRIDSLRNIVRDPHVALMFLYPGSGTVMRVNGKARVSLDAGVLEQFATHGKPPRSVILVKIDEAYFQCARAVIRGKLWTGGIADPSALPTPGAILQSMSQGGIDGGEYDADWPGRAAKTMW